MPLRFDRRSFRLYSHSCQFAGSLLLSPQSVSCHHREWCILALSNNGKFNTFRNHNSKNVDGTRSPCASTMHLLRIEKQFNFSFFLFCALQRQNYVIFVRSFVFLVSLRAVKCNWNLLAAAATQDTTHRMHCNVIIYELELVSFNFPFALFIHQSVGQLKKSSVLGECELHAERAESQTIGTTLRRMLWIIIAMRKSNKERSCYYCCSFTLLFK